MNKCKFSRGTDWYHFFKVYLIFLSPQEQSGSRSTSLHADPGGLSFNADPNHCLVGKGVAAEDGVVALHPGRLLVVVGRQVAVQHAHRHPVDGEPEGIKKSVESLNDLAPVLQRRPCLGGSGSRFPHLCGTCSTTKQQIYKEKIQIFLSIFKEFTKFSIYIFLIKRKFKYNYIRFLKYCMMFSKSSIFAKCYIFLRLIRSRGAAPAPQHC